MMSDVPRLFNEYFPRFPLASLFGSKDLEHFLIDWSDVFFIHRSLDTQPHESCAAVLVSHGYIPLRE